MKVKYRMRASRGKKIFCLSLIMFLTVALNAVSLADAFVTNENLTDASGLIKVGATWAVNCLGLLYFVVHDIIQSIQESEPQFIFEEENGIPFVDREELLTEIQLEILAQIARHGNYYTKNMRFGLNNGKESFAKRLCWELQQIKNGKTRKLGNMKVKPARKIGNIFFVDYSNYRDSFEQHVKTNLTYVKGKINIVVVLNPLNDLLLCTDSLKHKDVFFVFLNFNNDSEDMLFFADDKIVELLNQLKTIPEYAPICAGKTEEEISAIAAKLGSISNNNIGTIVEVLISGEFSLLLETDKSFVDFYVALKHGRYQEAEQLYLALPTPPPDRRELQYKQKYEAANLAHFLGGYREANRSLELLLTEMGTDTYFMNKALGQNLYSSTILLRSHVLKHQGRFDDAAALLKLVGDNQRNICWLRSHFSINIFQINELFLPSAQSQRDKILQSLTQKMDMFKQQRTLRNSDFYFYEAFYPIVWFYSSNYDPAIIPDLIKMEDCAIAYYEVKERRYVTNCYYIKAELLRINQQWKESEEYYRRCYDIYCHNGDKDVLYLVAIACKCLLEFEGITLNIPFDWDAAIDECKQQEEYDFHKRLISQMELAGHDQEYLVQWLSHYRTTINPIP